MANMMPEMLYPESLSSHDQIFCCREGIIVELQRSYISYKAYSSLESTAMKNVCPHQEAEA
jgi:hypothetical protein